MRRSNSSESKIWYLDGVSIFCGYDPGKWLPAGIGAEQPDW
jgi:hypothetical protein